jgi:endonuclease-3 related protein
LNLAQLIHPVGYYHAKAFKLQALVRWLRASCGDNLVRLFALETADLRQQLLAVHGIGPETADSILLYAGNKPVFVIDAYTRRIFSRLGLKPEHDSYDAYQTFLPITCRKMLRNFSMSIMRCWCGWGRKPAGNNLL